MSVFRIWIMFLVTSCTACATQLSETPARGEREPYSTIYLVNHGWHAGVVLPRARIPEGLWPVSGDFPGTQYLEVGWGDRDYYRTTDPHMGLILKAALLPRASVLHITGFSGSIPAYFRYSEVIEIELSSTAFSNLAHTIAHSFARNSAGNTSSLGQGLYGNSRFYQSREMYHLFNTFNVWTARVLRAAALPFNPARALTVENLMSQAREFGVVVQTGL